MRILVFGSTGQVARSLIARAPDGVALVSLGREAADFTDPAACAAHINGTYDAVINAVAYTNVDGAEDDQDTAMLVNGDTPGALARACADHNIPFLHVSTDYVFNGTGTDPFSETDDTAPLGAYGATKRAGELAVIAAGGQSLILRTSWVFSSYGQNFVKTMIRLSKDRDALTIVNDQIGGPTPAGDIATALLSLASAMHTDKTASGIYHYSGAPDVSWADFATEIFRQTATNVTVTGIPSSDYPTRAERPLNSRLDCRALQQTFGIERPNWKNGLTQVLNELGETTQ